jgi:hypothetical protein
MLTFGAGSYKKFKTCLQRVKHRGHFCQIFFVHMRKYFRERQEQMRANAKNCLLHENLTNFLQLEKFGFLLNFFEMKILVPFSRKIL